MKRHAGATVRHWFLWNLVCYTFSLLSIYSQKLNRIGMPLVFRTNMLIIPHGSFQSSQKLLQDRPRIVTSCSPCCESESLRVGERVEQSESRWVAELGSPLLVKPEVDSKDFANYSLLIMAHHQNHVGNLFWYSPWAKNNCTYKHYTLFDDMEHLPLNPN